MKIAMIMSELDPAFGTKYYCRIVGGLTGRGNSMTVLTRVDGHGHPTLHSSNEEALSVARSRLQIDDLCRHNVRVLSIPGLGIRTLPQWIRSLWCMTRFFRQENPPIIHTHGISDTLLAYAAARLSNQDRRPKIVTSFHGVFLHTPNRYRIAACVLSCCSDIIMPVSNSGAEKLKRYGLSKQKKILVLPNGVDLMYFDPTKYEPHPALAALREAGTQLVGIIGRLSPEKGHNIFLKAAAKVTLAAPRAMFIIVGDGPVRPELEQMVSKLSMADRVIFIGQRHADEIPSIIAALDIVVLTSHMEAFPLTALETMAMQKPLVATAVGDVPEIIEDQVTGFLAPAQDADTVSASIIRLLKDPELRAWMGVNARRRVKERWEIETVVKQIEEQYRNLEEEKMLL